VQMVVKLCSRKTGMGRQEVDSWAYYARECLGGVAAEGPVAGEVVTCSDGGGHPLSRSREGNPCRRLGTGVG